MLQEKVDEEKIWSLYNSSVESNECDNQNKIMDSNNYCNNCNMYLDDIVCFNCGLVINNEYSTYSFEETIPGKKHKNQNIQSSRLIKLHDWITWDNNDDKNEYKLNKYTRGFCEKLQIKDSLIEPVCEMVSHIMKAIKDGCDGPKRSRVKDGIIIVCIYYISKNSTNEYSYIELAKKNNLNMKYISKADKLLMELISSNKVQFSKTFIKNVFKTEEPIDYVIKIIDKYQLTIERQLLEQVSKLIELCNNNDILLDHTPLSIGVSCFYYILDINKININIKIFSELYDLSMVTIMKTFNKLKQYTNFFEMNGIKLNEMNEMNGIKF